MINSIIESSNKLSINQFDTEIEILKAVGDELIKEYFLELEGVYIEESASIPNIETEKVPAIQKIGDWFKRIINRIVAYITSKRVRKMIEKITESKRFEDREDDEMME
jgi:ribosomal protein S17E